jgi:hypothetical protein
MQASSLNDHDLFMHGPPADGGLTTIGFNHHFRFDDCY